jgi:hypothetical protein
MSLHPGTDRYNPAGNNDFTLWQQHMRGALSQLPMASGPWIWRPTDQAQRPEQMDFLEGLQS